MKAFIVTSNNIIHDVKRREERCNIDDSKKALHYNALELQTAIRTNPQLLFCGWCYGK